MTARQRLDAALAVLASDGERPPCGDWHDGSPWLSEQHGERAQAARWCAGCPVLTLCAAVVADEKPTFGVWAGVDRTKPTRKRDTRRTTERTPQ